MTKSGNTVLISSAGSQHGCATVVWICYQGSWHRFGSGQLPLFHDSKLYFQDLQRPRIILNMNTTNTVKRKSHINTDFCFKEQSILFIHTDTSFRSVLHTVCVKHLIFMVLEITCITCKWWNDIRQSHKWAVHDTHLNFPAKASVYQPDYVPYSFKCTTEIFLGESGKRDSS